MSTLPADYADVLWVDDDPAVVRSLLDAFPGSVAALTGEEGLALLRARVVEGSPFRVVVADVVMHDVGGVELCQRARVVSPRTRRVLLSGVASVDPERAVNDARAEGFVRKPPDVEALREQLAELRQRAGDSHPRLRAVSEQDVLEAAREHQHACAELERSTAGAAACFDLPPARRSR